VSPTYAFEVGGTPILAPHLHKFMGIRNGIDMELWNPETCHFLTKGYNADTVVRCTRLRCWAGCSCADLLCWLPCVLCS
jgi:glycogen synthase